MFLSALTIVMIIETMVSVTVCIKTPSQARMKSYGHVLRCLLESGNSQHATTAIATAHVALPRSSLVVFEQ